MDNLGDAEARVGVVYEHTASPSLLMGSQPAAKRCWSAFMHFAHSLHFLLPGNCATNVTLLFAFQLETTPKSGAECELESTSRTTLAKLAPECNAQLGIMVD